MKEDLPLIIARDIAAKVKEGGIIILSGFLFSDEADILECYTKLDLSFIDKMQLDEWIALVFKK